MVFLQFVRSQAIPGNGGHNNYGRREKSSDQSARKIGLFSSWSQRSAPWKRRRGKGSGSGAILSEGVNDSRFFGSPHKHLSPGACTFVLLARGPVFRRGVRCNSGSQNWCTFRIVYIAMADRGCIGTAHVGAPVAMVFQRCCSDIVVRAVYEPAQYSKTGCFPIAASAPSSCKAVWIIRNILRPKPNRTNC
jgi:hypothetical protein